MKIFMALFLSIVTVSVSAQDSTDSENGHAVFEHWCAPCHAPGPKHPGTQALDALYKGALPGALEARTDLTAEFVNTLVRNGVSIMPFFRKTEISDEELNDLAAYLTED
ncbi:cytochrome c [Gammaproteobacteria bacterium]|nr:cytochrome c [Gammaproteobacteria bacterium]